MAFDEELDSRVGEYASSVGAVRKKMFGGTGYMFNGNMMAGVHRDRLVLRLNPADGEVFVGAPGVEPFDITGRQMAGWVTVDPDSLSDDELRRWLDMARDHAASLPPK